MRGRDKVHGIATYANRTMTILHILKNPGTGTCFIIFENDIPLCRCDCV